MCTRLFQHQTFTTAFPHWKRVDVRPCPEAMEGKGTKSDSKGKTRASDEEQPLEPISNVAGQHQGEQGDTILTRIAKSAAAVPSALLGSHIRGSELPRLGASEKGESSRSAQRPGVEGEISAQTSGRTQPAAGAPASALRTGQAQEHIAREEASFADFLDATTVEQTLPGTAPQWPSMSSGSTPAPHVGARGAQTALEQEALDGRDVVALLSTMNDEPEPDYAALDALEPGDISKLHEALFGQGQGSAPVAWDSLFNFIPSYLRDGAAMDGIGEPAGFDRAMHLGMGVGAEEAWQPWIEQWSRVLTDYRDEVWGDLGHLREEARVEIRRLQEVRPDEKPPQPASLLRLRAILGHLRGTTLPP